MILELKRVVAYICPICSDIMMKTLDIFSFSGDNIFTLSCSNKLCHTACINILQKKDKYKINISCPICGENHTFIIKKSVFWTKRFFSLKCPVSGIQAFFIGEKDLVENAVNEHIKFISEIQDSSDGFDAEDDELSILYELADCIRDLAEDNMVYCTCGCNHITATLDDTKLLLSCDDCNSEKLFFPTEDCLLMLLNAKAIVLGN